MTNYSKIQFELLADGSLGSLIFDGVEFAERQHTGLFEVQFRDFIGNALLFGVEHFRRIEKSGDSDRQTLCFSDCPQLPGTEVHLRAEADSAEIRWQIDITPGRKDFQVEWIDFPRLVLRRFPDGKYLLPFAEGTLVDDLNAREAHASFRCAKAEYPMTGVSSFYPGPAAMQFEAFYNGNAGLCIVCRDTAHAPKSVDFAAENGNARVLLQHFTGGGDTLGYDVATIGFHGDWQDAAEIYRDWMEANDPFLPAKLDTRIPRWFAESPVVLAYPVKGTGLDHGGLIPNEYYPYSAALPVVERYRQRWESRILALLMHWEGTAPWAPPYVWPPTGGEAPLAEFVEKMHAAGDAVGLYGSGIGWTQRSMIDPNYDCTQKFESEHVENEICVGPRGETYSRVCNGPWGQRLGYDLCPARPFSEDVVTGEIGAAARLGIDYLQYFDQNQGCAAPLCYAAEHGHPALPGAWHTSAMRQLLQAAENAAGDTMLGCENAAAEPYMETCRLNDLRNHLAWGAWGVPVPLYPFLFHEYTAGFSGNGVCLSEWVDVKRTPFFLQWVMAWNFASGNLLSVVLKDGGRIHWHWGLPWSVEAPEQEPLLELIGNLTAWRRNRASEYLVAGRMEKTPYVSCGTRTIHLVGRAPATRPAVETSAWSKNGKRAILLVNYGTEPEPCRVEFESSRSGTIFTRSGNHAFHGKSIILEVPPLDAILCELKCQPKESEK